MFLCSVLDFFLSFNFLVYLTKKKSGKSISAELFSLKGSVPTKQQHKICLTFNQLGPVVQIMVILTAC